MKYPIARVTTQDGYILHGLFLEPKTQTDKIIIHIHGSGGNFYYNDFYPYISNAVNEQHYAFLATNNRGSGVYNIEVGTKFTGTAIEKFEDCLFDIDAWIDFALALSYQNIILQGHSFGTNKIEYYMKKGRYRSKIKALLLLGFCDSYGNQLKYLKKIHKKNKNYLKEANDLIKQNKPCQLLSDPYANCGELPQTAESYLNFMSEESELSDILPLRRGKNLKYFQKINIPILAVIGDQSEYTIIPIRDAIKLLEKENPNVICSQITNCPHGFTGKEKELVKIIEKFLCKL